ncbi:YdaU family protein [Erysipelothrix sp. HDW6C]|uniref:YdaU family protein n=1 Tax=Erysipelothrix sp. HDW6C TaxID=2714930 RepID=UPI00140B2024|nr:YdaU family protein [Erysipelothrix sp. HDW6C]QIK70864.1 YdaU family protein [Erysipelothrix sp. HDW6C]
MENKDPAFLMYSSDFLTGTYMMTMEERGQYITLMCLQHQKGRLAKGDIDRAVPNVSDYVMENFITDDKGSYYNQRLEKEIDKRKRHSQKQRLNGAKGGRPKGGKNNPKEKPNDTQDKANNNPNKTQKESQNISQKKPLENENEIDIEVINIFKSFDNNVELQDSLEQFALMRVEIGDPLSQRAAKMLLTELKKIAKDKAEMVSVLNTSIINNWKSVYPVSRNSKRQQDVTMPTYSKDSTIKGDIKEVDDEIENMLKELED